MSLLLPLGLLGLLGIAALILIYLLRPNYQQKIISSTYVWKMSLKYRRKRIPVSKLRNILIIICQILIIVCCALILAQPFIKEKGAPEYDEKIIVIDASANMLATNDGKTRFRRAVEGAEELTRTVSAAGGAVSVIVADNNPSVLFQGYTSSSAEDVYGMLDGLECSYSSADIAGAMSLAENILAINPKAEVVLYTATRYLDSGSVRVENVAADGEWNAAILSCREVNEENYYSFDIQVACYGMDADIILDCEIYGVNENKETRRLRIPVRCENDEVQTVNIGAEDGIYSYDYVYLSLNEEDSVSEDNVFYLYGGTKQTIKVEYYSTLSNNFFSGAMMVLRDFMRTQWDFDLSAVPARTAGLEGYDFYIFEHAMPTSLPDDGIVLLVNPGGAPYGAGFTLGDVVNGDFTLAPGTSHAVTKGIDAQEITVTQYRRIVAYEGYEPLLYCNGDPVLLVKNEPNLKMAVLSFSLNHSNLPVLMQFPLMIYNIINYFMPPTVTGYVYDVDDAITLNARGTSLSVNAAGENYTYDSFPAELKLSVPGVYTFTQTLLSQEQISEYFYVKIAAKDSNIVREEESLTNPYAEPEGFGAGLDLLIYFAGALVALLFLEWWLQSREY